MHVKEPRKKRPKRSLEKIDDRPQKRNKQTFTPLPPQQKASRLPPPPPPAAGEVGPAIVPGKKRQGASLLQKMRQRLQGGHFRWLNEQLYSTEGDAALELMQQNPDLYEQYHVGFREQTKAWPQRPVDAVIKWLRSKPDDWHVADLGCGDAEVARSVKQTVHSFDLISTVPGVVACNMANLPLKASSIDATVFCLSLMGVDYGSFLEEAARITKPKGRLWIAEVHSRFIDAQGHSVLDTFIKAITKLGFELRKRDTSNSHFFILEFQGQKDRGGVNSKASVIQWPALTACQYKKR